MDRDMVSTPLVLGGRNSQPKVAASNLEEFQIFESREVSVDDTSLGVVPNL